MKTNRTCMLVLLTMLFVFAMFPVGAMAADDSVITVEESYAKAGATVNVDVTIENNPGIIGGIVTFTYDPVLTLIDARVGDALSALTVTKPGNYASPARFLIDGESIDEGDIKDGVILTLTFTVSENAEINTAPEIQVTCEDMIDNDLNVLNMQHTDGFIEILSYTPGDLNDDGRINATDTILTRRSIVGGYEQDIITAASDVNDDNKVNATDVVLIRRYIAGGYGVKLLPHHERCAHEKNHVEAVAATCETAGNIEYWYCETCDIYFKDANSGVAINAEDVVIDATGHTEVVDPKVDPNYENEGLTEGSHCSTCNKVIVAQEVIPKLEYTTYDIVYHIDDNDKYLQSLSLTNPNPTSYVSEKGTETLKDIVVPGYNFVGWFTAQTGGEKVTKINIGETGNKTLYAQWEKVSYEISFKSEMVPIEPMTYSVGEEKLLPTPQLDKYTFVGWSDANGKIWDSVPAGTTGNFALYANWASNRNKAVAKATLDDPIICEDPANGLILFTYEIGEIQNVPCILC